MPELALAGLPGCDESVPYVVIAQPRVHAKVGVGDLEDWPAQSESGEYTAGIEGRPRAKQFVEEGLLASGEQIAGGLAGLMQLPAQSLFQTRHRALEFAEQAAFTEQFLRRGECDALPVEIPNDAGGFGGQAGAGNPEFQSRPKIECVAPGQFIPARGLGEFAKQQCGHGLTLKPDSSRTTEFCYETKRSCDLTGGPGAPQAAHRHFHRWQMSNHHGDAVLWYTG